MDTDKADKQELSLLSNLVGHAKDVGVVLDGIAMVSTTS